MVVSKASASSSVLVIFPGALGDLICVIPTLRAIARSHPQARLELMARAELARFATGRISFGPRLIQANAQAYSQAYSIDRRETAQLFSADSGRVASEAQAFFGAFAHVYSFFAADDERFRTALDAASGGRTTYLPFRPPGTGHVAAGYLRALATAPGAKARVEYGDEADGALDCSIEPTQDDIDKARHRIAQLGLEAGRYLLILPGSGSPAKNWPVENFAALAQILAARLRPLVVLGPAETGLGRDFAGIFERIAAINAIAVKNLELEEVAGLARIAGCFVGNDSGVSHLAAAVGARGVVIFGPTDPERWRPLDPLGQVGRTRVIRREPLSALDPPEVAAALGDLVKEP